jgi:hypothetical protein
VITAEQYALHIMFAKKITLIWFPQLNTNGKVSSKLPASIPNEYTVLFLHAIENNK